MRIKDLPTIDVEEEERRAEERLLAASRPAASLGEDAQRMGGVAAGADAPASEERPLHAPQVDDVASARRSGRARYIAAAVCAVALVGAGAAYALTSGGILKTEEPEAPVAAPTTVRATVKVDNVLVPHKELARGDVLENVQEAEELTGAYAGSYWRAELNGATVYVEKSRVRTSDQAAFEEWVGYATADAIIYAKPDFSGDDIRTLVLNEEVAVLDEIGDVLFVRNVDGYEGYMPADKVMREKAEETEPEDVSSYSYNYGYSNDYSYGGGSWSGGSGSSGDSGGSGGSSSDSAAPAPSTGGSTSGDGDEMTLPTSLVPSAGKFLLGVEYAYADEVAGEGAASAEGAETSADQDLIAAQGVTAVVLLDGTQTYLGILNRGDEVTVKVDDLFDFPESAAQLAGDGTASGAEAADDASGGASGAAVEEGADDAADASEAGVSQEELDAAAAAGEDVSAGSEDMCTVLINDQEVLLPERILRLEDAAAYEPWTGYAAEGATLFSDYALSTGAIELGLNQELTIVDEAGSVLVVERDGAFYCIDAAFMAKEPFEEPEPGEEASEDSADQGGSYSYYEPQYSYSYSGGGSGSSSNDSSSTGGSDGGASAPAPDTGGSTAAPSEEEVWTPTQK